MTAPRLWSWSLSLRESTPICWLAALRERPSAQEVSRKGAPAPAD